MANGSKARNVIEERLGFLFICLFVCCCCFCIIYKGIVKLICLTNDWLKYCLMEYWHFRVHTVCHPSFSFKNRCLLTLKDMYWKVFTDLALTTVDSLHLLWRQITWLFFFLRSPNFSYIVMILMQKYLSWSVCCYLNLTIVSLKNLDYVTVYQDFSACIHFPLCLREYQSRAMQSGWCDPFLQIK